MSAPATARPAVPASSREQLLRRVRSETLRLSLLTFGVRRFPCFAIADGAPWHEQCPMFPSDSTMPSPSGVKLGLDCGGYAPSDSICTVGLDHARTAVPQDPNS
jgi:hypothetical protein